MHQIHEDNHYKIEDDVYQLISSTPGQPKPS